MEKGLNVKFPVAAAAGIVELLLLKYPPKGQPLEHKFLFIQGPRPSHPLVKLATRAMVNTLLSPFRLIESAKCFSIQFNSISGKNFPSGRCDSPSFFPLTPIYDST